MDVTNFPFGRTHVSKAEILEVVDTETAIEVTSRAGIEDADDRVQQFLSEVPHLLKWLDEHGRQYPWRETTDPWTIYATEILLQRTRADAVDEIYDRFFTEFATPRDLHRASETEIREIVRSLGFVNHRTRTLREAVAMICDEYGGNIPQSIEALKQPWRAGEYTARATLLFAMEEPVALVDSNFARVFKRVLGYDMPQQPHKSAEVYAVLDSLVPSAPAIARAYNLAILDLGALICVSDDPLCEECPVARGCTYYQNIRNED